MKTGLNLPTLLTLLGIHLGANTLSDALSSYVNADAAMELILLNCLLFSLLLVAVGFLASALFRHSLNNKEP